MTFFLETINMSGVLDFAERLRFIRMAEKEWECFTSFMSWKARDRGYIFLGEVVDNDLQRLCVRLKWSTIDEKVFKVTDFVIWDERSMYAFESGLMKECDYFDSLP